MYQLTTIRQMPPSAILSRYANRFLVLVFITIVPLLAISFASSPTASNALHFTELMLALYVCFILGFDYLLIKSFFGLIAAGIKPKATSLEHFEKDISQVSEKLKQLEWENRKLEQLLNRYKTAKQDDSIDKTINFAVHKVYQYRLETPLDFADTTQIKYLVQEIELKKGFDKFERCLYLTSRIDSFLQKEINKEVKRELEQSPSAL